MRKPSVLVINSDLTSNGGISNVIKSLYQANDMLGKPVKITLLKTNHYKDKPFIDELYILVYSLAKCLYLLSFKKIDIVHIHSSAYLSFYRKSLFFFLAKVFGKKIIFHLHSSRFYDFFLSSNPNRMLFIKKVFRNSDLVITLCKDWEVKLKNRYPGAEIITIHNPINIIEHDNIINKNIESKTLNVLFLAFLIPNKGIKDIILLAKRIKESGMQNIKIIVGGKGEMEKSFINAIKKNDLSGFVDFRGWVSGKTKNELLKKADVFFLPSYNEGMPISILEAMCNRLAIVSTPISGIPDLVKVGINGYLKEPGDIDGFYEIFSHLASKPEIVRKMGNNSLNLVQKFDSTIIFKKLNFIYESLKK